LLAQRLLLIKVSAIYRLRDYNHPASMPGGQPPAPGMTDLLHCTELKYNDLSNYVKMYDYTNISLSFTSPTQIIGNTRRGSEEKELKGIMMMTKWRRRRMRKTSPVISVHFTPATSEGKC
jgi:hypothetical protein